MLLTQFGQEISMGVAVRMLPLEWQTSLGRTCAPFLQDGKV